MVPLDRSLHWWPNRIFLLRPTLAEFVQLILFLFPFLSQQTPNVHPNIFVILSQNVQRQLLQIWKVRTLKKKYFYFCWLFILKCEKIKCRYWIFIIKKGDGRAICRRGLMRAPSATMKNTIFNHYSFIPCLFWKFYLGGVGFMGIFLFIVLKNALSIFLIKM